MKKNLLRSSFAIVLCLALLAGCSSAGGENSNGNTNTGQSSTGTPNKQTPAQKLSINLSSVPTIDPQRFNAEPSYNAIKGYVEGLVAAYNGEIRPGVAESWEVAPDNMSMTFHLRKDACWSDGTPLTSKDFLYAFHRLADPNNACDYRWVLAEIVNGEDIAYGDGTIPVENLGVTAPDDYTLEIKFHIPAPYYLDLLDMPVFYPVKQELVEKYGDEYAMSADKLLGNGPFVVKEYLPDQKIVYTKNDKYWNKDAIKLDEVTAFMMTDAEVEFAAFRSGELDVTNIPLSVAPEYLSGAQKLDGAVISSYMNGAVDWYCVNIASTTNPILGNKDFRLALNYALDREQYVKIATNGIYFPNTRFVLPLVAGSSATSYYCDEYPMNVYKTTAEMDKAKEHLQKAMDTMGITDPSKISIAIKVSDAASNKLIAENCQDQWQKALNINVEIDTVTYKAMLNDRVSGDFDLVYAGWMPDYNDPYTYLGYFMSSNDQNGGKFSNPRYDELVGTANNFSDAATRLKMYAEAEQILLEEAGLVPLHVRQGNWACKSNLKGFTRFYLGASMDFRYAYFE